MKLKTLSIFIVLAAIWGASFMFMRVAAPEFGPVAAAFTRVLIATLALSIIALLFGKRMLKGRELLWAMGIGILNSAVPFMLFAYAALSLPAGYTAVLNATVPFWGILIGVSFFGQTLVLEKVIAMVIAVGGIAMMLGLSALPITHTVVLAAAACLLATLCYGISGNITQKQLKGVDSYGQAWGAMLGACIVLAPFALWAWPSTMPSIKAWAAIATVGVLCSAIAYILYFWLLSKAGLMYGLSVTLLIPVFGIFWGIVFLGETLTLLSAIGALITLVSTSVVLGLWSPKMVWARFFSGSRQS